MSLTNKDFSSEQLAKRPVPWRLWLVVLVLHAFAIAGLNAVLALNRLATQADASFDVAILPSDVAPPKPKPAKVEPAKAEPAKTEPAKTPAEPAKAELPTAEATPAPPAATALPPPQTEPVPASASVPEVAVATAPSLPANPVLQDLRAVPPAPAMLRYILTKGNDSAKASLSWKTSKSTGSSADTPYEAIFEATYFGISVIKQSSAGLLGSAGLMPTRYADKRRGKSEQATHFEREKALVTFSNNRPEAKLAMGSQDRASFLVQLASLYAGQPERFKTGQVIELPVASVDELEVWVFEIGAPELIQLPIGQMDAIKLFRRPRRAFDIAVEVWLAPKMDYLPVRIRLTDSGGVTDSQLASKE